MSDHNRNSPNDTPPSTPLLPVIPAGQAHVIVKTALDDLAGAYLRLEGAAIAIARALDSREGGAA